MRLLKVLFVALVAFFTVVGGALLAAAVGIAAVMITYARRLVSALTPQRVRPLPNRHPWADEAKSGSGGVIDVTATEVKS